MLEPNLGKGMVGAQLKSALQTNLIFCLNAGQLQATSTASVVITPAVRHFLVVSLPRSPTFLFPVQTCRSAVIVHIPPDCSTFLDRRTSRSISRSSGTRTSLVYGIVFPNRSGPPVLPGPSTVV